MGDYVLAADQTVDMVILALPLEMSGLTLTFDVTPEGGVPGNRSLPLKVAKATTLYGHNLAAGDFIIFDPFKQAYIKGLIVPGWSWTVNGSTTVYMRESVEPWDDNNTSVEYGKDENSDGKDEYPVVNATKLTYTNTDPDVEDPKPGSAYSFSIFAPRGQKWQIKVLDSPGGSVASSVTITQTGTTNVGTGGVLTGIIGSPSKVDFTLSGAVANQYISFSILLDDTTEYSINSEVARNNDGCQIK